MASIVETPQFPPDEMLIESDGEPLESDWHVLEIGLLRELVHQHLIGRRDFFAGGNMFIYYSWEQVRNRDFLGPDFFFLWDSSPMPLRRYWTVWKEEFRFPDVIVELLSPTTATTDRTTKKDLYEREFKTNDYFCYDPDTKTLDGWRLHLDQYQALVPNEHGWLWCEELKLWLGTWEGSYLDRELTWLRFYTPDGKLVPTIKEASVQEIAANKQKATAARQMAAAARQETVVAKQVANAAKQDADVAKQEAAAAKEQAEEQRRRAAEMEVELLRLRAMLDPNNKKD